MVSGLVFDIQRCALHDGPGIRSVAFLKGCPLRCLWCCNPESQSAERQLFYHSGKCLSCFGCVGVCPAGALRSGTEGVEIDFVLCVSCGKCGKICPAGAIGLYGYEMTAEEVVVEFERDAGYYASSGGGITLSGGEPLMQAEFASEILMLSKKKGWHTAVETCGTVPAGYLSAVLPFADLFLLGLPSNDKIKNAKLTSTPIRPEFGETADRKKILKETTPTIKTIKIIVIRKKHLNKFFPLTLKLYINIENPQLSK